MFRKLFLAAAIIMAGMLLLGCGNSSTIKTISAEVEGAGDKADSVHLKTFVSPVSLAQAAFKNSQFSIKLPKTVSSELLETVENGFDKNAKLSFSDPSVKCCIGAITASKNGNYAGILQYGQGYTENENVETGSCMVLIYYVDRDVDITGTIQNSNLREGGLRYNCNLKKGWNYVALISHDDGSEMTTEIPSNLKWELLTE